MLRKTNFQCEQQVKELVYGVYSNLKRHDEKYEYL